MAKREIDSRFLHDGAKTRAKDKIVYRPVKLSSSLPIASVVFTRKTIVTTKSRQGPFESRAPDHVTFERSWPIDDDMVTRRCARRTFSFNRFNPRISLYSVIYPLFVLRMLPASSRRSSSSIFGKVTRSTRD